MYNIANFITSINLICGGLAVVQIVNQQYSVALILLFIALIADFLDGFVARALHQASPLGKELDSLGDVISFGLAPCLMVFQLFKSADWDPNYLVYFSFLLLLAAAFRLAKFNITTDHTAKDFSGVPTPAMALYFFGLIGFHHYRTSYFNVLYSPYSLLLFVLLFSFLMLSKFTILKIIPSPIWIKKHWLLLILYLGVLIFSYSLNYLVISLLVLVHIIYSIIYFLFYEKIYSKN